MLALVLMSGVDGIGEFDEVGNRSDGDVAGGIDVLVAVMCGFVVMEMVYVMVW